MKLALGVVGGLALFGATSAQAAQFDFIDSFTVETVTEVLRGEKATDFETEIVENDPRLRFKVGDTKVVADFYECEAKACKVLQFMITYEAVASDTVQAVNGFNVQYLYGKAALDVANGNGLISYRMINGHAGSSKGQIADEFRAFLGVTGVLLEHMKKSATTAQVPGDKPAMLNASAGAKGPAMRSRWSSLPVNKRP